MSGTALATVVVGIIGLCVSVISFFIGQKRSNTDDGRQMGEFMGEIRADIAHIKDDIKDIKKDRAGIDDAIYRAIKEHEKTYHSAGRRQAE